MSATAHFPDCRRQSGETTCQQHSSSCAENMVICVPGKSNSGFNCFISNTIVDLNSLSAGAQCFPLYWYEKVCQDQDLFSTNVEENKSGYVRHDAITDEGLAVFQAAYSGLTITKEDIFYLFTEFYTARIIAVALLIICKKTCLEFH